MIRNIILLFLSCAIALSVQAQVPVTYYGQVQPILKKNCLSCHHENGNAPFSLEKWEDVQRKSVMIGWVTESGYMPPWKANPSYRHFSYERILDSIEIATIQQWIAQGSIKGKVHKPVEKTTYSGPSRLDKLPDLVLKMKESFPIEGNRQSTYICYKIPYELERDTFISALEFIPGNKSLVHHASCQFLEVSEYTDIFSGPNYFVYGKGQHVDDINDYRYLGLVDPHGQMPKEVFHYGWLPGVGPQIYMPGVGFRLPKKGVLLIRNFHYAPSPVPATDQSYFNLYFASQKVDRVIQFAGFRPQKLVTDTTVWKIPANTVQEYSIKVKFHDDVSLYAINPHMHQLGKDFKAYCVTPEKDTIPLIHITEWDFNWQEFYVYTQLLKIPKGSTLYAFAHFDNTDKNPLNPFFPPQDVFFERGMEDNDEMMRLVILYLPYQNGDEFMSTE
jgi:hypothetical protein